MPHIPYFGKSINEPEGWQEGLSSEYFHTMALNECLNHYPENTIEQLLHLYRLNPSFSTEQFYFCLSGLKKTVYYDVYGLEAIDYLGIFERYHRLTKAMVKQQGYRANVFMIFEQDSRQMAVLFSPGEQAKCTPQELAAQINALGQKIYEENIFKGDARYCNVTALSAKLHGYSGIREGYLQTRRLNDLSFFHMEPCVLTVQTIEQLRNKADYRVIISECHRLQQSLDAGDGVACRKQLESLFLKTVKASYCWNLLQDALSYCKHMLELRCTARNMAGVDLESLCEPANYLRIEECVQALWPVLEQLCVLIRQQGPYQELMLRAIYYIKLHYAEDISLIDIAAYVNVNPNYLSSTFQKEMGVSLREFITEKRIEAAKRLLRECDWKVADIAEAVGIHDIKYFNRLFKKAEGVTPSEYRTSQPKK